MSCWMGQISAVQMEVDWSLSKSLCLFTPRIYKTPLRNLIAFYSSWISKRHLQETSNSIQIKANSSLFQSPFCLPQGISHILALLLTPRCWTPPPSSPLTSCLRFLSLSAISLASVSIPEHITYVPIKDLWGHCPPGWDPGFSPPALR